MFKRTLYVFGEIEILPKPKINNFIDLENRTFERLRVLGYAGRRSNGAALWYCECQCGNICKSDSVALRNGSSKSCGCLVIERNIASATHRETVGGKATPEYDAYISAKKRCSNKNHKYFDRYGGRGIRFKFKSFEQFIEHIGRRPSSDFTLERIDVNGHYESGNIKWATRIEQQRNRTSNHTITINSQSLTIAEWAEKTKLSFGTIWKRLNYGWCNECAVGLPLRSSCIHKRP